MFQVWAILGPKSVSLHSLLQPSVDLRKLVTFEDCRICMCLCQTCLPNNFLLNPFSFSNPSQTYEERCKAKLCQAMWSHAKSSNTWYKPIRITTQSNAKLGNAKQQSSGKQSNGKQCQVSQSNAKQSQPTRSNARNAERSNAKHRKRKLSKTHRREARQNESHYRAFKNKATIQR